MEKQPLLNFIESHYSNLDKQRNEGKLSDLEYGEYRLLQFMIIQYFDDETKDRLVYNTTERSN